MAKESSISLFVPILLTARDKWLTARKGARHIHDMRY
jgi:hypothetical protein